MITVTKKITGLFFILLGFLPLLFVLLTTIKKHDIQKRMKGELEKRHLQTIILRENEVTWMDEHEIWINNSMFDIHTKKLENGLYTFTGLYDEEETLLVEQERDATGKNNHQNQLLARLFKSLPVFYVPSGEILYPALPYAYSTSFISQNPVHPFREILTPPPQA